jgi:hypothetical protein
VGLGGNAHSHTYHVPTDSPFTNNPFTSVFTVPISMTF